jgi:hypothetical protein
MVNLIQLEPKSSREEFDEKCFKKKKKKKKGLFTSTKTKTSQTKKTIQWLEKK